LLPAEKNLNHCRRSGSEFAAASDAALPELDSSGAAVGAVIGGTGMPPRLLSARIDSDHQSPAPEHGSGGPLTDNELQVHWTTRTLRASESILRMPHSQPPPHIATLAF
jgi:hypothetical protein